MLIQFKEYTRNFIHIPKIKLFVVIITIFYITLDVLYFKNYTNDITFKIKSWFILYSKSSDHTTKSLQDQVELIKKDYQLAINYYDHGFFKLAEKGFVKVLKPVLSKPEFRILPQSQIIHIIRKELLDSMYHIGLIYLNEKIYPNNYTKAAAIFQYCFNFANIHHVNNVNPAFFLNEAYDTEKKFLQSIGSYNNEKIHSNKVIEYISELRVFRQQIKRKLDALDYITIENINLRTKKVEEIYKENIEFFINDNKTGLIQKLIADCIKQLGKVPEGCKYAIIALGSFASGTATPWSDLEFAILISNNDEKYKQYFRNLAKLFHIKIVNLGETQLRWVGIESLNNFKTANNEDEWFWDDIVQYGFSLDGAHWHACETPLGRKEYKAKIVLEDQNSKKQEIIIDKPDFELILTPDEMAKFQEEKAIANNNNQAWADSDAHLVQSLRSVALIDGSQDLLDNYRSKIREVVSLDTVRKRTIKILQEDINNFQLKLNSEKKVVSVDVKKGIYRLVDRIVNGFANYYNIMAQNEQKSITVWNVLDQMKEKGILSDQGTKHLKEALSIAAELRLRTYHNNVGNKNKESMKIYISSTYDINKQENQQLFLMRHFYQVMLRVQDLVKDFCNPIYNSQAEFLLRTDKLYLDDINSINLINKNFLESS